MQIKEFEEKFEKLFSNELPMEEAKEFLATVHKEGESKEQIVCAAKIMRKYASSLHVKDELKDKIIDIVGTGGDKKGSFNISSTVALVVSSLEVPVAKHGNRAATSKSGSADMLQTLGINLNLSPMQQEVMLNESNFIFMFAQNYHPGMKFIMPVRRALSHPTIFNFLGPLSNPANAKRYLLGVYPQKIQRLMAEVISELDNINSFVVTSRDGLDEISISSVTDALHVSGKDIKNVEIDPQNLGFELEPFDAILGDTPEYNANITKNILQNSASSAQKNIVLLNSAVALVSAQKARDIQEGIEMARASIESKKAYEHLQKIIKLSNRL